MIEFFEFTRNGGGLNLKAMQDWGKMLQKHPPFQLHDGNGVLQSMWQDADQTSKDGSGDKSWWRMHIGNASDGNELFELFDHLVDLRMSEAIC